MDTQIVMFLHCGILLNNKMKKISDRYSNKISKTFSVIEDRCKRLGNVWFYLYDIL